jgi:hypothetical protein
VDSPAAPSGASALGICLSLSLPVSFLPRPLHDTSQTTISQPYWHLVSIPSFGDWPPQHPCDPIRLCFTEA